MFKFVSYRSFLLLLFLPFLLQGCRDSGVREIPVSDFFRTPEKSAFKISPDGRYISYLKPYHDKQNLFIQELAGGKETRITDFTDVPLRDYSWTFGNHIIYTHNSDAGAGLQKPGARRIALYAFDLKTMKARSLLTENKATLRTIQARNRRYPDIITITANQRDSATFDVYHLNIRTGEMKTYITNPGNITSWYPDQDGVIRLAKASDGVDESILFRVNEGAPFKPIIKNNFKNSVDPIAFTGVKNNFYALSNVGRDKSALVEVNAENGREERVLFASDNADITEYSYSKLNHLMESVSWETARPKMQFISQDMRSIYDNLSRQLKGSMVKIIDRDSLEKKFIVLAYTDRDPGTYYLYQTTGKKLTRLANLNPALKPGELCEMRPVAFKASDGVLINGYLTLPQAKDTVNLPVVVLPHNGPFSGSGSRNSWGYSAEVQFLANRGYAVFQMNYRGTSGYGKAFRSSGFKQAGGKIQQDITDGVNWLINRKIANAKKIAIMGTGFGGFSALYGIAAHPALYNCAIVQSGLINFFTYMKDFPPYLRSRQQMMYEMVGNPETDGEQFRAISPRFHADKIKTPLLIFQGGRDPRANISDLNQFVHELQRRKAPVTYVYKEKERTSFNQKTRMQMYAQIEKFLGSNMRLKP